MQRLIGLRRVLGCGLLSLAAWPQTPPAIPEDVAVERNIAYDQYPETVLDVFQPKAPSAKKRPGVLVLHGGGWVEGSRNSVVAMLCLPYLRQGFVVVNADYRLAKTAPAPAAVQDALKAAKWFRDNARKYNVDPDKIVVTGDSAGGHLALMVGLAPKSAGFGPSSKVAAVVNFYGITDLQDQIEGPNMRPYAATWLPEQENRRDLARKLSPVTYVRKDTPPVLTIHGDADETVPYDQGIQLTKALRDDKGDAELISVPQGGHGFDSAVLDRIYPQIFAFLKRRGIMGNG